jgi:hypothetical protein
MQENTVVQPELELGMQELEAMDAPDFWGGFTAGLTISGMGIASATVVIT